MQFVIIPALLLAVSGMLVSRAMPPGSSSPAHYVSTLLTAAVGAALFGSYAEPIVIGSLAELYPEGIRHEPKKK